MKNIPIRKIKATQKELVSSENFSIRDLRTVLSGKDLIDDLHRHDFFLILALEKGSGHHEIDFTPFKVADGSIFFMRPGQVHKLTLKAGSQGYILQFKPDFYFSHSKHSKELLRSASINTLIRPETDQAKRLFGILRNIYLEYTSQQEKYEEVLVANLIIFFIELVRNRKNLDKSGTRTNLYSQERLDELMELLGTYISNHKQVSFYADKLNLSLFQLNAITKKTLGKTCSELINEHIVLESKRYLLATSNQVNQIAYQLGYEDPSYFIRFFKKHTGFSPKAFRHSHNAHSAQLIHRNLLRSTRCFHNLL